MSIVVISKYARGLIMFIASIYLIKYLSKNEFGEFLYFSSILLILQTLLVGPSPTLFTKYFGAKEIEFSGTLKLMLKFSTLIIGVGSGLYFFLIKGYENPVYHWGTTTVFFGWCIFCFNSIWPLFESVFRSRLQFNYTEPVKIVESLIWLFGIIVVNKYELLSIHTLIIIFAIRSGFLVIFFSYFKSAEDNISRVHNRVIKFKKDYFSLYLNGFFAYVVSMSDRYMLGLFSSKEELAYYGFASIFFTALITFPGAVSWYLLSRSGNSKYFNDVNYPKRTSLVVISSIILGCFCYFLAPSLIIYLKGDEYLPSILTVKILSVAFIFMVPSYLFSSLWIQKGKFKTVSFLTSINGIINISLNLYFLPKYGSLGAAITSLISYFIGSICNVVLLVKLPDRNYPLTDYFIPRPRDIIKFLKWIF